MLEKVQMLHVQQRMCFIRKVRQQFLYRQNVRRTGIFDILPVGIHEKQRFLGFRRRVLYLYGDFRILFFRQPVCQQSEVLEQQVRCRILQYVLLRQQPRLRQRLVLLPVQQRLQQLAKMLKQQVRSQNVRRQRLQIVRVAVRI